MLHPARSSSSSRPKPTLTKPTARKQPTATRWTRSRETWHCCRRDDNSVLNNSVFGVKRRFVITLDLKTAHSFQSAPPENVFLKYYDKYAVPSRSTSRGPTRSCWEAYLEAMYVTLSPYLLEDIPRERPGSLRDPQDGAEEDAA